MGVLPIVPAGQGAAKRTRGPAIAVALATVGVVAAAGCVRQLPPATTPEARTPAVDLAVALTAGAGRLVIDVVDGPTPVQRVDMASEAISAGAAFAVAAPEVAGAALTVDGTVTTALPPLVTFRFTELPSLLCPASPCVVDLPAGNLILGFPVIGDPDRLETELIHVAPGTTVYRRALSEYRAHPSSVWGILATSIGGTAALTGTVLLPIGLAGGSGGLTAAGGLSLGVGAALTTLGILALRGSADTFRPGSSIHF